mmetsp:Transcript_68140/g.168351  ORF Transcript_68140/g.168351 Transcript_68140/m.168351 type:complete len:269 (+) Transcript_68140:477-1283(+)|eukprot:CAMPEP_0206222316 /NCGR_PEP_ID=MMETSP0047_2-20121206/5892_1 /ASSEMBLY_ACC=CAM_ASM_000192 /TAXON_ID=195065 /ORGANISM="Chroomonas mesostigmatica_cf, Strain CCMP1168" /LENGTH=268 /DNA_ID=CAMNT_0053645127 /DNA_START=436 /DNA_END=1242 /DNA_ORIENTATION=+
MPGSGAPEGSIPHTENAPSLDALIAKQTSLPLPPIPHTTLTLDTTMSETDSVCDAATVATAGTPTAPDQENGQSNVSQPPPAPPSVVSHTGFGFLSGRPGEQDLFIPPLNFGRVSRSVYRSGFPGAKNFRFLQKLGLSAVLNLSEHDYPQETCDFFKRNGIQYSQMFVQGNKEPFQSSDEEVMCRALHQVLDATPDKPLLIHCTKGTHRTGCLVGCLRKLEGWSLTPIFDEYRRYAGTKVHLLDQQFIEFFQPTPEHWAKERITKDHR